MNITFTEEEKDLVAVWAEHRSEPPLAPSILFQREDQLINRFSTGLSGIELDGDDLFILLEWFNRTAHSPADLALARKLSPAWTASFDEAHPEMKTMRSHISSGA